MVYALSDFHIDAALLELGEFSRKTRRDLHRIPEPSGQEYKTSAYCRELMQEAGFALTTFDDCTGFWADLVIDPTLPWIAFRADMDGLEMDDLTGNEYTSEHPGCAHNCGHDTHMAIVLTAARHLAGKRAALRRNMRFVFQMAEEDMRVPGADRMVAHGCMNGIDEVYALHNDASMPTGTVKFNAGVMSSYGSAWTLKVHGVSAHGSTPQKGLDAIREAARLLIEMDYVIAKKTSPFSPAVFGCGMINGGTVPNAVPDHVEARGTIRAMDAGTDALLKDEMTHMVRESEGRGYRTTMEYIGYPAVINHRDAYQRLLAVARDTVPAALVIADGQPMSGSEDFSMMVNAARDGCGAMFFLGSGAPEKGICNYLHSSPYFVDDDCLLIGAQLFARLAER